MTAALGRTALMLNELRLPTIKRLWPEFAERSDKEGWPAARFLATLAEHAPEEPECGHRGNRGADSLASGVTLAQHVAEVLGDPSSDLGGRR